MLLPPQKLHNFPSALQVVTEEELLLTLPNLWMLHGFE
jgi:hypothetical protein